MKKFANDLSYCTVCMMKANTISHPILSKFPVFLIVLEYEEVERGGKSRNNAKVFYQFSPKSLMFNFNFLFLTNCLIKGSV